jgi:hypothetical protein
MNTIPAHVLLGELDDLIRTMPSLSNSSGHTPDHLQWLGRASAAMSSWNRIKATAVFEPHVARLVSSSHPLLARKQANQILMLLHQARSDLRLATAGPMSVAVPTGSVFDYFDEVRKVIEEAKSDLLFVDPYLDAEFVSRFLGAVAPGTAVRMLARERLTSLVPAATLFASQAGLAIQVRAAPGFHDRYVFVDAAECYQSGASFKDGAKKAPTTLTQIVDAFAAVQSTYESLWISAAVHL